MLLLGKLDAALHVVSAAALGFGWLGIANLNGYTTKKRYHSSDD